jgi:hypothetical protein
MPATVQAQISTGATPTVSNAETGIGFGLADAQDASANRILKPAGTGTNYSYYKTLHLQVTAGGGSTSISDRKIRWATAPTTGLYGFFKDGGNSYTQASGSNKPADTTASNGAVPSGYTALSTSFQTWDAQSAAATNGQRNGNYVVVVVGVGGDYADGAGTITLPDLELQYLES